MSMRGGQSLMLMFHVLLKLKLLTSYMSQMIHIPGEKKQTPRVTSLCVFSAMLS